MIRMLDHMLKFWLKEILKNLNAQTKNKVGSKYDWQAVSRKKSKAIKVEKYVKQIVKIPLLAKAREV